MKNKERHRQNTFQKLIPIIGLIFILGFFGSMYWSSTSYSNSAIIAEQFESTSNPNNDVKIIDKTPDTNKKYLEHQYLLAEHFYKNNNITKAQETYDLVLKNQKNTAYDLSNINFDAVHWNRMLIGLGNEERTKTLEDIDILINSDLSQDYKNKASALKEKLNSFWYGWAN